MYFVHMNKITSKYKVHIIWCIHLLNLWCIMNTCYTLLLFARMEETQNTTLSFTQVQTLCCPSSNYLFWFCVPYANISYTTPLKRNLLDLLHVPLHGHSFAYKHMQSLIGYEIQPSVIGNWCEDRIAAFDRLQTRGLAPKMHVTYQLSQGDTSHFLQHLNCNCFII